MLTFILFLFFSSNAFKVFEIELPKKNYYACFCMLKNDFALGISKTFDYKKIVLNFALFLSFKTYLKFRISIDYIFYENFIITTGFLNKNFFIGLIFKRKQVKIGGAFVLNDKIFSKQEINQIPVPEPVLPASVKDKLQNEAAISVNEVPEPVLPASVKDIREILKTRFEEQNKNLGNEAAIPVNEVPEPTLPASGQAGKRKGKKDKTIPLVKAAIPVNEIPEPTLPASVKDIRGILKTRFEEENKNLGNEAAIPVNEVPEPVLPASVKDKLQNEAAIPVNKVPEPALPAAQKENDPELTRVENINLQISKLEIEKSDLEQIADKTIQQIHRLRRLCSRLVELRSDLQKEEERLKQEQQIAENLKKRLEGTKKSKEEAIKNYVLEYENYEKLMLALRCLRWYTENYEGDGSLERFVNDFEIYIKITITDKIDKFSVSKKFSTFNRIPDLYILLFEKNEGLYILIQSFYDSLKFYAFNEFIEVMIYYIFYSLSQPNDPPRFYFQLNDEEMENYKNKFNAFIKDPPLTKENCLKAKKIVGHYVI